MEVWIDPALTGSENEDLGLNGRETTEVAAEQLISIEMEGPGRKLCTIAKVSSYASGGGFLVSPDSSQIFWLIYF